MTSYRYNQIGLSSTIQLGKSGGRLLWNTDHFEATTDGSTLAQFRVATTPVNANDAASKAYVDSVAPMRIQEEGVSVSTTNNTLNFVGAAVTAADAGGGVTSITVSAGGSLTTQEEGVDVDTAATTLNFVGSTFTASNAGGNVTTVTGVPPEIQKDAVSVTTANNVFNLTGSGISAVDSGGGVTTINVDSATGVTNQLLYRETITTTGGTTLDVDLTGVDEVRFVVKNMTSSATGNHIMTISSDGGTTFASNQVQAFHSGGTEASNPIGGDGVGSIGIGDGGPAAYGIIHLWGLAEAHTTSYKSIMSSSAAANASRDGYFLDDNIHNLVRFTAGASGTFTGMDVDVYVRMKQGANSTLLQTIDLSGAPASPVEFKDLDGYDTVTIFLNSVRKSGDSAARLDFQVSTDNGATWLAGTEYFFMRLNDTFSQSLEDFSRIAGSLDNTGTESWDGSVTFYHLNGENPKNMMGSIGRSDGNQARNYFLSATVDTALKVNAIRLFDNLDLVTNYDSGVIKVVGAAVAVDASATVGGGGGAITVQEEGVDVSTTNNTINFVGAGILAADAGGGVTSVTVNAEPMTIQEEGVDVSTTNNTINFVGDNVTAADAGGGVTSVTVTAASPYDIAVFYPDAPAANATILAFNAVRAFSLPDDFAGAFGTVGSNPGGSFVMDVAKNGVSIGSITISNAGVFTFATTGGAAETFVADDLLTVSAPGTTDASILNISFTFTGTRT